mmetsp:Transcript_2877/g.3450  ORF Transcript_2877/g.3450 Transcript_2877/m.3450 type:complete len:87 (-) Transcript_2877:385-645(-)
MVGSYHTLHTGILFEYNDGSSYTRDNHELFGVAVSDVSLLYNGVFGIVGGIEFATGDNGYGQVLSESFWVYEGCSGAVVCGVVCVL